MHFTKFAVIFVVALGFVTTVSTVGAAPMDRPKLTPEQEQILKPIFNALETIKAATPGNVKSLEDSENARTTIDTDIKKIAGTPNDQKIVQYIYSELIKALSSSSK
ncbi:hypothetical protein H4219_006474 [Mycoemilia scoparia]|uniref:Uncharacterized protein n=1 Tax=Mycoemilia scoparia TaxID=417184 RepID=A0A9W7ZRQ3_9FUNG|nr:hypothetical protein H4219_006474 [Mycoemilia scoparia]